MRAPSFPARFDMRNKILLIAALVALPGAHAQAQELQPDPAAVESAKPLLAVQGMVAKRIVFDYQMSNGGTIVGDVTIA